MHFLFVLACVAASRASPLPTYSGNTSDVAAMTSVSEAAVTVLPSLDRQMAEMGADNCTASTTSESSSARAISLTFSTTTVSLATQYGLGNAPVTDSGSAIMLTFSTTTVSLATQYGFGTAPANSPHTALTKGSSSAAASPSNTLADAASQSAPSIASLSSSGSKNGADSYTTSAYNTETADATSTPWLPAYQSARPKSASLHHPSDAPSLLSFPLTSSAFSSNSAPIGDLSRDGSGIAYTSSSTWVTTNEIAATTDALASATPRSISTEVVSTTSTFTASSETTTLSESASSSSFAYQPQSTKEEHDSSTTTSQQATVDALRASSTWSTFSFIYMPTSSFSGLPSSASIPTPTLLNAPPESPTASAVIASSSYAYSPHEVPFPSSSSIDSQARSMTSSLPIVTIEPVSIKPVSRHTRPDGSATMTITVTTTDAGMTQTATIAAKTVTVNR